MLSLLAICFIAGGLGATLQGMLGIGTGIIIVPLLTFVLPHYGIQPNIAIHIALATSMAAIATNSISAVMSHYRRGNIKWNIFKEIILFSMLGSALGAFTASHMSGSFLKIIFGFFLLSIAIYMLLKKSANEMSDSIPDLAFSTVAAGGTSIGFMASMIGSGGGVLMVPFLHTLKLKMRYAVGTSTLIGFPVAIIGALTYIFMGLSKTSDTIYTLGYLHWPALIAISSAGILFVPLGVKLATTLHTQFLQRFFAAMMILMGLKMIMNF